MTRRTKVQLRKQGIVALLSFIITIVTGILLIKTFPYWNISMRLDYIEEQARISGWTDEKTANYEELIIARKELARNDDYINWLLQTSHSHSKMVIRDFLILGMCVLNIISICTIYHCAHKTYKIVTNKKMQVKQRNPYRDDQKSMASRFR